MNLDDLIMTTRIRLARNIAKVPFSGNDRNFFQTIASSIMKRNIGYTSFNLNELPERDSLFEQHLISADFLENVKNGVLVMHQNNNVSIMLGEEDHIRIQTITNKFNLLETYQTAKKIADNLELDFDIAKNDTLGYLTRCPTNLGGGLRASVMMYLPALTMTKKISEIFNNLDNRKITIRGVYGENSDSSGCIYQISNQNCINLSDSEVLAMINKIINEIALNEFKAQQQLWQKSPDRLIDKVMRAWGILTNAHLLTSQEATEYLAWLKLGVVFKIIAFRNNRIIDDLFFITKPATLMANQKITNIDQISRDRLRAVEIRQKLLSFRIK